MSKQSEAILEENLLKQLETLDYQRVLIEDEKALLKNLKTQLEKHNKTTFTEKEFQNILNRLARGNVFERAKILRDKMQLPRENGEVSYIEFINQDQWCKNEFQIAQQISVAGSYQNRYDVTLLVNGLPLVQIELKRRGLELKEAFNQTNRYQRHSYDAGYGLFQYIQFFVISNGVNTKYYANNRKQSFKQTFYWADKNNKNITKLEEFTSSFLEPCHVAKMITRYTVLNETEKILMILRPYQYYAIEAIIDRAKNTEKNGYIWHTTGSGKTITSFKASQILKSMPEVKKVVFVVDRKDLDYHTITEFNNFSKGSIDGTDNTQKLVDQFADDTKLIVTTIQKLNSAITKDFYSKRMEKLKDEKIVFIFDECHRSQFGDTHKRITSFFNKHQMFGFTGTPIFADNSAKNQHGKRTTKDLFGEQLHTYVITDAIKDENVLKFSIEYVGKYKRKEDSKNSLDIKVEEIDTKELLESDERIEKITDYILANHDRKTHSREFTAMFCVGSIDALVKYYELLRKKKQEDKHQLTVATIFSYTANEDDKDANGFIESSLDLSENAIVNEHSRDKLESYIQDYNKHFQSKFTTKDNLSFYNYYNDIAKKVKEKKIDILLVVNMFLTGFDSKTLNTLYVDKNLKYHGLIQAFSRTNRILNEVKSQGNIVCFRNLKQSTDDAIALFANKNAQEIIFIEPYEKYVEQFNEGVKRLKGIAPTVESVDHLKDEEEQLKFVQAFRELMRLKNILQGFADFSFKDLYLTEQEYEDYKSKYLDIHDKVKKDNEKEKVSILDDVDFELELIHRDEINVTYILHLLRALVEAKEGEDFEKKKKAILDIISGEISLRSKKELIEKFISENLIHITDADSVENEFENFLSTEKKAVLDEICKEEDLDAEKLNGLIGHYIFTERKPLNDEIIGTLKYKPKLLERKSIISRLSKKIFDFVETFIEGV